MGSTLLKRLKSYYNSELYNIYSIKKKTEILNHLNSKASANWGQGKIGDTKYYKLAEYSPEHVGSKSTVIVCTCHLVEKYFGNV